MIFTETSLKAGNFNDMPLRLFQIYNCEMISMLEVV